MPLPLRPTPTLARGAALVVALAGAALAGAALPALAQAPGALAFGPVEPEVRLDAIVAEERQTYQLGLGAFRSVGRAVRLGLVVGGGVAARDGDDDEGARAAGRAELVGRFVLRASATGRPRLYLGAGAGATWVASEPGRGLAHLLVGAQGGGRRWEHAVELGLGGGVRLGVALRRAR